MQKKRATHTFATTVVLEDTWTPIGTDLVLNGSRGELSFELVNGGASDLTDFRLSLQFHPDAAFAVFLTGTDWAATTNLNKPFTSTVVPNTLGDGKKAYAVVKIPACHAVRLEAKRGVASDSVNLTAYSMFSEEL